VVAPACHETASAVSVVPVGGPGPAFIHVGGTARVGAVLAAPLRSEAARALGFSNEGGVDGAVYLHRGAAGLRAWQQCRRAWAAGGKALDDEALAALAATGKPFLAAVDLDAPPLRDADDLPAALQAWCARSGQAVPESRADVLRTILESLAWRYRRAVRDLEGVLGRPVELVHLLGEGAQNALLCQLTADACGRPVRAGPAEAAALGNVLAQAVAARACGSWGEARALVRGAFPPIEYEPREGARWDEADARAEEVLEDSDSP
jgi:rhamnulokinase